MKAISLPFNIDGYGKVVTTTNPSKVWADRVKTAVTTPIGTRIMMPSYGCATPMHLFRNAEDVSMTFDTDIAAAFDQWLPDMKYTGAHVDVYSETGEVAVSLSYTTPLALESDSVTIVVEY